MLIRPQVRAEEDFEDHPSIINPVHGSLVQVRNTIYIQYAKDSNEYTDNHLFDVILVSEMIRNTKNVQEFENYYKEFKDFYKREPDVPEKGINYFTKVVHFFNGVCEIFDPSKPITETLKNMKLYPSISYSIGENEHHVFPQSKVLYLKHGSHLLTNVLYTFCYSEELYKLNLPKYSFGSKFFTDMINHIDEIGCYFDITDPRYPDILPYHPGHLGSQAVNIRASYTGESLLANLVNTKVIQITSDNTDRLIQEERNNRIRRELMNNSMDDLSESRELYRVMIKTICRNLAVDFMKISVCSMMENIEIIYDNKDANKIGIKNIREPFNQIPVLFMATKLNMIQSEFKSLCDDIFKKYGTLLYKHIRISLFDSPYEILIKFTDFDDLNQCKNICSETFRLNKSEAILDYVNEGLHTAKNNNSTIMNTNIQLLQWNENSQNK